MGRCGTAEEIPATIDFLPSEGAGYITGRNIRVDNGLMRGLWPHMPGQIGFGVSRIGASGRRVICGRIRGVAASDTRSR